jgi:hypothetical protein
MDQRWEVDGKSEVNSGSKPSQGTDLKKKKKKKNNNKNNPLFCVM